MFSQENIQTLEDTVKSINVIVLFLFFLKRGVILELFFPPLTSAVLESEVREPPHVPQTHRISHHGQDKIHLIGPVSSGLILIASLVIVVTLIK